MPEPAAMYAVGLDVSFNFDVVSVKAVKLLVKLVLIDDYVSVSVFN